MHNFFYQVSINFQRIIFRNLRFLFFNLALPIAFYLLFTKVMTNNMSADALTAWNSDYFVSMVLYSSLMSSVITVANTLLDDQENSFDLFIVLSPISRFQYYASMIVVFFTLSMSAVVSLGIVASLVNHVTISFVTWLAVLFIVPLVSIPLIFIGIMVSLTGTSNVVNLLSNLVVFPMAIASGLWWPLEIMPDWLKAIGTNLPTYFGSSLVKAVIHHQPVSIQTILGLLIWSILGFVGIRLLLHFRKKQELLTI